MRDDLPSLERKRTPTRRAVVLALFCFNISVFLNARIPSSEMRSDALLSKTDLAEVFRESPAAESRF